jgi:hypothetical protein
MVSGSLESLGSSEELQERATDGDEDSFLAAAAQEAEDRGHAQAKKHGLRSFFKEGAHLKKKGEKKLTQSKSASEARSGKDEPPVTTS